MDMGRSSSAQMLVRSILDAYGCTAAAENVMLGVEIGWRVELQDLMQEAHDQRVKGVSLTCPFGPLPAARATSMKRSGFSGCTRSGCFARASGLPANIAALRAYLPPIIDCFDGMVISWTAGTSPDAGRTDAWC